MDGTLNQGGSITEEITFMMSYRGHKERAVFEVCDLGKESIIVGLPWLRKHNPEVNWDTGEVKMTWCPQECNVWIRHAKKECKRKRIANRWRYCYIRNTASDSDGFRMASRNIGSTIILISLPSHFQYLPHSPTVAYSPPSVVTAPRPT